VENNIWFPFLEQREKTKKISFLDSTVWAAEENAFPAVRCQIEVEYGKKKTQSQLIIRARFRSWDLWVMGPPRFRCATLILLSEESYKGI
jgi:coproporphyrinogen III oxidase